MKKVFLLYLVFVIFSCETETNKTKQNVVANNTDVQKEQPVLEEVLTDLFSPVFLTHAFDERLFIVEQRGTIRIFKNGKLFEQNFLDIRDKVEAGKGYSEKGLLGLAFHPDYNKNGKFYIYYSSPYKQKGSDHKSILAEYKVSDNPDKAGKLQKILLEIPQPESNHNGGMLTFGPDGYLYLGLGDGGGAGDRHGKKGYAQDLSSLLGKIIRIDVNSGNPYSIPADNPFQKQQNVRPEIYAYGLRNPWRFSFDKKTGDLFCGDVGQNAWEEIDIIERGKNYGWRAYEGDEVFDKDLVTEDMVKPIHVYPRNIGISVIGGYVYRGTNSDYTGNYFFADWNGKVLNLRKNGDNYDRVMISSGNYNINSLGEDMNGNLYVLTQSESGPEVQSGKVYRIKM